MQLTCEAVRHTNILPVILAQQHAHHALSCTLGDTVEMVYDGEKDEGSDGHIFVDEREGLCRCSRHCGRADCEV